MEGSHTSSAENQECEVNILAENIESGKLIVNTVTGFGIFLLKNVLVTVISETGSDSTVLAQVYTDATGSTPEIPLPALATDPSSDIPIPAKYTVEATKPGYQKVILHGVNVYPAVTTIQRINMVALPDNDGKRLTEYDSETVTAL